MWRRPRSRKIGAMKIGHVHLKVADLDRAIAFYRDDLGFTVQGRIEDLIAFLSGDGGYHHHIALNTLDSAGGEPPAAGTTGLYHVAILFPTRAALAQTALRVKDRISHGSDHGATESVYLSDPDGNGIELYWDRPAHEWPRTAEGKLALVNLPLDVDALLSAA
jgi:catechol 2,3-dioxygenase